MKTIKLTIAILIAFLPLTQYVFIIQTIYPPMKDTPVLVVIWTLLMCLYLTIQFGYYSDKFCKWFDSKLK